MTFLLNSEVNLEKVSNLTKKALEMFESVSDEEWARRDVIFKKEVQSGLIAKQKQYDETLVKNGFDIDQINFLKNCKNPKRGEIVITHQILDNNPIEKLRKIVKEEVFKDTNNRSYILSGDCGRGKTLISHLIALKYVYRGLSVKLVSDKQFRLDAVKISKGEMSINSYIYCDLLVLDDIAKLRKPLSDTAIDLLNDIICERIRLNKKLIGTTNKNIVNLLEKSTQDRMRGRYRILHFKGKSLRRSL